MGDFPLVRLMPFFDILLVDVLCMLLRVCFGSNELCELLRLECSRCHNQKILRNNIASVGAVN